MSAAAGAAAGAAPPLAESVLRRWLAAQLERRDAEVLGLRASAWTGSRRVEVGGRICPVRWCPSALALREALMEHELAGGEERGDGPLVLLTDRPEADLGGDVLARLAKRTLHQIHPWRVLEEIYQARHFDVRLRADAWLAEALLEVLPEQLDPEPTGTVRRERVWSDFLVYGFGFAGEISSLKTLLRWSLDGASTERFRAAPERVRRGVAEHLGERLGPAGEAALRLVEMERGGDAVAVGLACRVLADTPPGGDPGQDAAVAARLQGGLGQLKGMTGVRGLGLAAARRWADAAEDLVRELATERGGPARAESLAGRGDALLEQLEIADLAAASEVLPSGYRRRLEEVAAGLDRALARHPARLDEALQRAAARAAEHARHDRDGGAGIEPALELARWLEIAEAAAPPPSFAAAALAYARGEAFADAALAALRRARPPQPASAALRRLRERAEALRERSNERFAGLLAAALEAGTEHAALVPVEQVLDRVATPLATARPILILVLDGLSCAVFLEWIDELLRRGWQELGPPDGRSGHGVRRHALAALPSETAWSRGALLTGALEPGEGQAREKKGFAEHAGLRAAGRRDRPPKLYHKLEVREQLDALRAELRGKERRVVGVVLNAVDESLDLGDPLTRPWTLDAIGSLGALLEAAAEGERVVLLTSDHGHVLEHDLEKVESPDPWARHRLGGGPPGEGEIELHGPRVRGGRIVALWSGRRRYTARSAGYHGGAAPQEMVLPLAILAHGELEVEGMAAADGWAPPWTRTVEESPDRETATVEPTPQRQPMPQRQPPPRAVDRQGELFPALPSAVESSSPMESSSAMERPSASERSLAPDRPFPPWIARLLACETYQSQLALAGPRRLDDAALAEILALLDRRGGRMTEAAFARALNLTPSRLRGKLIVLQGLLNVEGYPVITHDTAERGEGTIHLDRALLREQFELAEETP